MLAGCNRSYRMRRSMLHLPERELLLRSKVFKTRLLAKPSGRAPEKLLLPAVNLSRENAIMPKLGAMLRGAGNESARQVRDQQMRLPASTAASQHHHCPLSSHSQETHKTPMAPGDIMA